MRSDRKDPPGLVELSFRAGRQNQVVDRHTHHRRSHHHHHVPVEGLIVHRIQAAAEQKQLLRVHGQVAEMASVAHSCVGVGDRVLKVEPVHILQRAAPRKAHGHVHLDETIVGHGSRGRQVVQVGRRGLERAHALVGILERLRQELGDDVAVRRVDVHLRKVGEARRRVRQGRAPDRPQPVLRHLAVRVVVGQMHRQHPGQVVHGRGEHRPQGVAEVPHNGLAVAAEVALPLLRVRLDGDDHVLQRPRLVVLIDEDGQRHVHREEEDGDVALVDAGLLHAHVPAQTAVLVQQLQVLLEHLRVQEHALRRHEPPVHLERGHDGRAQGVGVRHGQRVVLAHRVLVQHKVEALARQAELLHLGLELGPVKVLRRGGVVGLVVGNEVDVEVDRGRTQRYII